ncbi:MAG: sigma-54-dependent transcriptional regulator [Pyrinomonadaceae bacterium]
MALNGRALVIDDESQVRGFVAEVLRTDGWDVSEAATAEQAFAMLRAAAPWSLVFCDVMLGGEDGFAVLRRFTEEQPEARIVLMTGHGSAVGALDALAFGAYDYLLKPFSVDEVLTLAQAVRRRNENPTRRRASGKEAPVYKSDIDLIGRSGAFVEAMKIVGRVAATNLPVLVAGESGTGKEIVARAIHLRSQRADKAFVAVNCGALPAELIESELFGHVRGAFTGATIDRRGLWEEADGGTIFLDEITETTPAFQVKVLRTLQDGEIRRVGSNQTLKLDVRVIAATNRDAEREVREGGFRQDLLYRLNAVTIHLPALRERREDIRPLAKHFAQRVRRANKIESNFSADALRLLENYDWPGNIRELENAVVRAIALCDRTIQPEHLPERIRSFRSASAQTYSMPDTTPHGTPQPNEWLPLAEIEGRYVARVLAHTGGNKQAAARLLGIDRKTLQRMIVRHGLNEKTAATAIADPLT